MKNLAFALVFGALCGVSSAMAHEGHDHSYITETASIAAGQDYSIQLIGKEGEFDVGMLPESWRKVPAKNAKLHTNGDGYYIVTVLNEAEQKTLYVLMTSNGDIYGANFTGEFAILNR